MRILKDMRVIGVSIVMAAVFACCGNTNGHTENTTSQGPALSAENQSEVIDTATFAGGCFWCVEASFDQILGVEEAFSGYAGGTQPDPTYRQVAAGRTEYAESVQVYYNAEEIDYETLLAIFFTAHDPTQLNRQGPDTGKQYRSAIFYHNSKQKQAAEDMMAELALSGQYDKLIVTELKPYSGFYMAEDYHQDYEEKNPNNPYIQNISKPKIEHVRNRFSDLIKVK